MIFVTAEDGKLITTESGIFLTLDLAIHFADIRRAYAAIPRMDEFIALPRTDEFRLTGD